MALSDTEKQELLTELERAKYSGTLRVRFRDRDVTYRSLEELDKVIDDLKDQISAPAKKKNVIFTSFGRGR